MESHPNQAPEHHSAHLQVRTLLAWKAPGSPYVKRGREFYINTGLLVMAFEIILFLFSQYLFMVVILAFVFFVYALTSVPPQDNHYRITTEGLLAGEYFYIWDELYDFYFKRINNTDILHIGTKAFYPGEITVVLRGLDREHVKQVLLPYLPYREYVKPTFMEKSSEWLEKTFPLDRVQ